MRSRGHHTLADIRAGPEKSGAVADESYPTCDPTNVAFLRGHGDAGDLDDRTRGSQLLNGAWTRLLG
jgi:hypothetical protein